MALIFCKLYYLLVVVGIAFLVVNRFIDCLAFLVVNSLQRKYPEVENLIFPNEAMFSYLALLVILCFVLSFVDGFALGHVDGVALVLVDGLVDGFIDSLVDGVALLVSVTVTVAVPVAEAVIAGRQVGQGTCGQKQNLHPFHFLKNRCNFSSSLSQKHYKTDPF